MSFRIGPFTLDSLSALWRPGVSRPNVARTCKGRRAVDYYGRPLPKSGSIHSDRDACRTSTCSRFRIPRRKKKFRHQRAIAGNALMGFGDSLRRRTRAMFRRYLDREGDMAVSSAEFNLRFGAIMVDRFIPAQPCSRRCADRNQREASKGKRSGDDFLRPKSAAVEIHDHVSSSTTASCCGCRRWETVHGGRHASSGCGR